MTQGLPSGTVTFLFTDVEGSTKLLHERGAEGYADALAEHRRVLREAFGMHGGVEVDTQGDAFFVAFPDARRAVAAAASAQTALASGPIRVRMGLHTGKPHLSQEGYVGEDVHLGARIAAAGHGGQVLLSRSTRELVGGEVSDLGEHRLKDFAEPVWLFQVGSERFPPLKTISNTNLPRPASSFVGREEEVTELATLLRDGARFLTLTGPGGSGKTRLAIEAAAELVPDFKNGVFWVGLAPIRDPELVAETVAQTLGAKDGLAAWIGQRELLLLLDNLEQVIDAAPALAGLVEACPNLHLLVTSRELLRVRGEVDYPVLPLADPEAAALFSVRAGVEADETVAELCRRLDNLPLALELAAARATVLSPAQILDRLSQRLDLLKGGRDADPRQQTLRATIEWSHDLLTEAEKQLFARLSVFRGGATLEAAEKVADADIDTLQSLVDKSLVRHTGERFWMLETIREYATEQLHDDTGRARHLNYYIAFAEQDPLHMGAITRERLDRVEAEHDNFRGAFDYALAAGGGEAAQRLAAAIWQLWTQRGYLIEGRRRVEDALAADPRPTRARAAALYAASGMAVIEGRDFERARLHAEEALELNLALGEPFGIAYSRFMFGFIAMEQGDFAQAREPLEESFRLFEELGSERYIRIVGFNLAWALEEIGELDRACALGEDLLAQARAAGDERAVAFMLDLLTPFAQREGRLDEALSKAREGLRIRIELDDRLHIADGLSRLAMILARQSRPELAAQLLCRSLAMTEEELGIEVPLYQAKRNAETVTLICEQLNEAAYDDACERGRKLSVEDAVALALGTPQAL